MSNYERQYIALLNDVLYNGEERDDRTGTGTYSVFGRTIRVKMSEGLPLLTSKRVFYKGVLHELLWMLSGKDHIKYLKDNDIHIWDAWAAQNDEGYVGPIYGVQWRSWARPHWTGGETIIDREYYHIDQLAEVISDIKHNPTSRRLLVSAWNPGELDQMALPPCHYAYQFYVRGDDRLDILVNQRSADLFLGVPFDIASYATLLHMVAMVTGKEPGELIYNFGDMHIYKNHVDAVKTQLSRAGDIRPLPKLEFMRPVKDIDDFVYEDFLLTGYNPHPTIKAEVSV